MDLQRRQFLSRAFEVGGLSALISLGMSYKTASIFAGSLQQKHKSVIARSTIASGGDYTATYRSFKTQTGESVLTLVCDKPVGLTVGDMIVAFTSQESSMVVTPPSGHGFTQIDEAVNSGDIKSWYKIADSGDVAASTFTWTFASTTSGLHVTMVAVQKSGGTWVVPTTTNYHSDGTSAITTITPDNVTTQDNSCLLSGWYNDGAPALPSIDEGTILEFLSAGTCKQASYYQNITTGATESRTLTWNISTASAAAMVVCYAN